MYDEEPYEREAPPLEETTSSGVPWDLYQDPPVDEDLPEADLESRPEPTAGDEAAERAAARALRGE